MMLYITVTANPWYFFSCINPYEDTPVCPDALTSTLQLLLLAEIKNSFVLFQNFWHLLSTFEKKKRKGKQCFVWCAIVFWLDKGQIVKSSYEPAAASEQNILCWQADSTTSFRMPGILWSNSVTFSGPLIPVTQSCDRFDFFCWSLITCDHERPPPPPPMQV